MAWGYKGAYHKLRDGHPPDNAVRTLVKWTAWHLNKQKVAVLNVLGALRDASAQLRGLPAGGFVAAERSARAYLKGVLDAIEGEADSVLRAVIAGVREAFEEIACDIYEATGDDDWVMERAADKILHFLVHHCLFDVERDDQRAARRIVKFRQAKGLQGADANVEAEVVAKFIAQAHDLVPKLWRNPATELRTPRRKRARVEPPALDEKLEIIAP